MPKQIAVQESPAELLRSVWEELRPELTRLVGAMGVETADVLQDVYVAACQKCPPQIERPNLRRWLLRVTINRCNLEHRRRSRWRAAWHGLASLWAIRGHAAAPAEELRQQEERRAVRRALEYLDPQQRSLLVLRYFAELDSGEIGKILDLPGATVRGRLREARKQLALELKRAGFGDE